MKPLFSRVVCTSLGLGREGGLLLSGYKYLSLPTLETGSARITGW